MALIDTITATDSPAPEAPAMPSKPGPVPSGRDQRDVDAERMKRSRSHARDIVIPSVKDPERRARAEDDFLFYLTTYFPHLYYLAFGPHQIDRIKKLEHFIKFGGNSADAHPRASGKTTDVQLGGLWAVTCGPDEERAWQAFMMIFRANQKKATRIITNVKRELQTNELLLEDFPEVCAPIRELKGSTQRAMSQTANGGEQTMMEWHTDHIILPTVRGSKASGNILQSLGIDSKPRGEMINGHRVGMSVVDDPESRESVKSELITKTIEETILSDISGLGGPGRRVSILWRCTIIKRGCLADLYTDPAIHPEWNGSRVAAIQEWPERDDLWQKYFDLFDEGERQKPPDTDGRGAMKFYVENREEMDQGAVVSWEENYIRELADNGTPLEVSALQHLYNIKRKFGDASFASEYQNAPLVEDDEEVEITPELVMERLSGSPHMIVPEEYPILVQFVDVRAKEIHYQVMALMMDGTSMTVDYDIVDTQVPEGDKRSPSSPIRNAMEFRVLEALRLRRDEERAGMYVTDQGEVRHIDMSLVDAGWLTDVVVAFCVESGKRWRPTQGLGTAAGKKRFYRPEKSSKVKVAEHWFAKRQPKGYVLWFLDVDHWKHHCHERFLQDPTTPGAAMLFGNDPKQHTRFAKHICAERFDVVKRKWEVTSRWNHFLDTCVGCHAAGNMQGVKLIAPVGGDERRTGGEESQNYRPKQQSGGWKIGR